MKIGLFLLFIFSVAVSANGEETVHLNSGQFQRGKLISQSDEALTFEFKKGGAQNIQTVTIPWTQIQKIEFAKPLAEIDAMANPETTELSVFAKLWDQHEPWLSRPESRTAQIGMVYADKLAAIEEDRAPEQALDLYSLISEKAWDEEAQSQAFLKRLETLFSLGREREAIRLAETSAEESENPIHLLEAKYLIATRSFDELKLIEEEHPRWYLDDEVRPGRNKEYNKSIDNSLYPFLFYGTFENQAARGLIHASEVYQFGKDYDNAKICAEDILRLYPKSDSATTAREQLAELSKLKSKQ